MLRQFKDDPARRDDPHLLPRCRRLGEQVEREELERAEQQKQQRARLRVGGDARERVDAEAERAA